MVWFLKHLWFGIYGCCTIFLFEKVKPRNSWDLSILSHAAIQLIFESLATGYSTAQFRQILQLQKAVGNISSSVSGPYDYSHRIHGAGIYANIGGILMGSMLPYIAYMDPMGLHIIKLTGEESSPDFLVDWLGLTIWGLWLETLVTWFFFGLEHVKTNDFTGFSTSQWWTKTVI